MHNNTPNDTNNKEITHKNITDYIEQINETISENLINDIKKRYSDIPYHNFPHAITVLKNATKLIKRCQRHNITVRIRSILLAALLHDAGYHLNHNDPITNGTGQAFEDKESLSAHIAYIILTEHNETTETILQVQSIIIATHKDKSFNTIEQKIIRAADLMNMADEYSIFYENTKKLYQEYIIMHGKKLNQEQRKEQTAKIISFYLSQDIYLTPEHDDENGISQYHSKVEKNLKKFMQEDIDYIT